MVVPKLLKSQVIARQKELAEDLQAEARILFFERMMYEINDSLTSILAVCEVEPKEAVPKVKQYIHRINQSLHNTKNYQSSCITEEKFNITAVLKNLVHVFEERYRKIKLAPLISDIKAPVQGNQSNFELLFFHIMVNLLPEEDGTNVNHEILIELRQKDQYAMITILKDHHIFSAEALEQINKIGEEGGFKGRLQITPQGKGVEVIVKIPLQFRLVTLGKPVPKTTAEPAKVELSKN